MTGSNALFLITVVCHYCLTFPIAIRSGLITAREASQATATTLGGIPYIYLGFAYVSTQTNRVMATDRDKCVESVQNMIVVVFHTLCRCLERADLLWCGVIAGVAMTEFLVLPFGGGRCFGLFFALFGGGLFAELRGCFLPKCGVLGFGSLSWLLPVRLCLEPGLGGCGSA